MPANQPKFKDYLKYFKEIGFLQCIGLLINFIFFRLKYMNKEDKSGYFLVKRRWLWYLSLPILLPLYLIPVLLNGLLDFFKVINSYDSHWIEDHDKELPINKRIVYRRNLWN